MWVVRSRKLFQKEHITNVKKVGKGNNFIEEHKAVTVFAMKACGCEEL